MKAVNRPALTAIRRGYAAQAMTKQQTPEVLVSKQPNGAVVAAVDTPSPVARVAVYMNAGPRNEKPEEAGICHVLRNAANFTTQGASAFGLVKNMQQLGANFTCSTSREHMIYNLECTKDKLDQAIEYLVDVTCKPVFFPWEISDSSPKFQLDLGLLSTNPLAELAEALHQAAYRDGLGRSLFMPSYKIGTFSSENLADYYLRNFRGSNMALVGVGLDADTLGRLSQKFRFEDNSKTPASGSGYHGGELRLERPGSMVHAAVVTEGAAMTNPDLAALSVLQHAMGTTPFIKYSSNSATSRVGKAAAQATDNPVSATCMLASYSDSGLFGFQVSCLAEDADKVLRAVKNAFAEATKGAITDKDVAAAKAQLKANYLMYMESATAQLEDYGVQAALLGSVTSAEEGIRQIDAVTAADVNKIAKKVINGKPSMAVVGNTSKAPYLDQLL